MAPVGAASPLLAHLRALARQIAALHGQGGRWQVEGGQGGREVLEEGGREVLGAVTLLAGVSHQQLVRPLLKVTGRVVLALVLVLALALAWWYWHWYWYWYWHWHGGTGIGTGTGFGTGIGTGIGMVAQAIEGCQLRHLGRGSERSISLNCVTSKLES